MAAAFDANRGNPEKPSEKLREVLAGWIDTVASQGEKALDSLGLRGAGGVWSPPVDLLESKDQILVYVDLPGVDPAQIETVLVGNMLTIKGELPDVVTFAGTHPHRRERASGAFSRSIPLPVSVNPDQVKAEARHGVLLVTLAKTEPAGPRSVSIPIQTSE